ncbi:MAG: CehA/McbA family metallohydrolase [Gemmataceae bacterium]
MPRRTLLIIAALLLHPPATFGADELPVVDVEGQPLAANVKRLLQAYDYLGSPFPAPLQEALKKAAADRDAAKLQTLLDPHVLLMVDINPESRVKVRRGPAPAKLQQAGFTPVLIKVVNEGTITAPLRISSPQAGPVYAGVADLSMKRQDQPDLKINENTKGDRDRFLHVAMFQEQPMTADLSGLKVEYCIALIYSSEAGKREATLGFDVGQGTQDLGFRAEVPILFDVQPAIPVKLTILDFDGNPTTGRFTFRDGRGRIYPPQPKRLAPDLFFQQHIYRHHGQIVLLPPGEFQVSYSRGPEYKLISKKIKIASSGDAALDFKLERWINPMEHGFYSGDHHIHAAGCAHYQSPTEGVLARDMFLQVKGEGLNVGCILTWGPCFQYQRQFFSPKVDALSEPLTLVKYDIEVSGFGSQALGHVCLLNLKEQIYPGADGAKGWPTWTTPVLKWTKQQGGYTGYAHSASGLQINPPAAGKRLLQQLDANKDGKLDSEEAGKGLLPEAFADSDASKDGLLDERELTAACDRSADRLPNLVVPEMNGAGAMEICVTVSQGLCDFISAMDTERIQEWNTWYHILNCGYPLNVSGETDFPCMSGTRVGQGRVYVQLGKRDRLDYSEWCKGLAEGRSYVSDGYAHALDFRVNDKTPGTEDVKLAQPGKVKVTAQVAFASQTPRDVKHGVIPREGMRLVGDTRVLHGPKPPEDAFAAGKRLVELVVNGNVVATREVPADDKVHELTFDVPIERSSWVALRQFPQLHTNPVNVIVAGQPIRASRKSALWCAGTIEQLWRNREKNIAPAERDAARKTFEQAIATYRKIAAEAP